MRFIRYFMVCTLFHCGAEAYKMSGRFYLGGYGATERYKTNEGGSDSNDVLLLSSRYFTKFSDLGEDGQWESTLDLRDSHDFFDKLDKEKLELTSRNQFQVRQLFVRHGSNKIALSYSLGRFPVPEAGSVHLDGAMVENRINVFWSTGYFAGYNAKRVEQSYAQFNADSKTYGAFLKYEPKYSGWDRNLLLNHAFVYQQFKSSSERNYIFHNFIYQWEEDSRIISLGYFDFVPSTKVQTASVIWQQHITQRLENELDFLSMDVIENTKRQSVLTQIEPSPYREVLDKFEFHLDKLRSLGFITSYGQRDYDQLSKKEFTLAYSHNQIWSPNWDLVTKLGSRQNFTSKDLFYIFNLSFFSRLWEINGLVNYAQEKNDDGTTTHPLITELNLSRLISKKISVTSSFQRAANENLTIYSAFIKLGYRFGNQELPPQRDGAPPRGPL